MYKHLGPLAHLVERFHGMEEATGSNPVGSTKKIPTLGRYFFMTKRKRQGS